jgi:hypothetical protein
MSESKRWYASRTIWGGVVALGAAVAGLFGIGVDASTGSQIASAVTDAAAAAGALIAILGRLDAKSVIS